MSCERFKTRLVDFALGAEDVELRAHLDACAPCRAELEAQRALLASIDRGLASLVSEEPSGDFAAHVRHRIAENASAPHPWFAGWMPVTAAALALVVLVGVLAIGRPPRPPQSAGVTPPAPVAPTEKARAAAPPNAVRTAAPPSVARGPRPPHEGQMAANREPEVLVPRGEMAAVMRLYDASWNGQADGASLMAAAIPTSESLKPLTTPELKISPLVIERLDEEGKPRGSSENR
jgi:hypothetical protein